MCSQKHINIYIKFGTDLQDDLSKNVICTWELLGFLINWLAHSEIHEGIFSIFFLRLTGPGPGRQPDKKQLASQYRN